MAFREPRPDEGESHQQLNLPPNSPGLNITPHGLDDLVICLRIRFWWFLTLFLQCFLFILMVACLSTPKWVKQGSGQYQWEGNVVSCTTCASMVCPTCGNFGNSVYSRLKDDSQCSVSITAASFCAAFKDLSSAGGAYFFFEIMSILLLGGWTARVVFLLLERDCFPKLAWLAYVYPALALLFHLLGLVIWAGISKAVFNGSCDISQFDGGKATLCATHGPALSVVTVLIYAIAVGLFIFAFLKSRPNAKKKEDESIDAGKQLNRQSAGLDPSVPQQRWDLPKEAIFNPGENQDFFSGQEAPRFDSGQEAPRLNARQRWDAASPKESTFNPKEGADFFQGQEAPRFSPGQEVPRLSGGKFSPYPVDQTGARRPVHGYDLEANQI